MNAACKIMPMKKSIRRREFVARAGFLIVNARGEYGGVSLYEMRADREDRTRFAVCTDDGPQSPASEPLIAGAPSD